MRVWRSRKVLSLLQKSQVLSVSPSDYVSSPSERVGRVVCIVTGTVHRSVGTDGRRESGCVSKWNSDAQTPQNARSNSADGGNASI